MSNTNSANIIWMTDPVVFQRQLYRYARRKGLSVEDSEDVASFGVQQILEGAIPKLKYRLADYFRDLWGKNLKNRPTFIHDVKNGAGKIHPITDLLPDEKDCTGSTNKILFYKDYLTFNDLELLRLKMAGYSDTEIGFMLGRRSKERVWQLLDELKWKFSLF